MKKPLVRKPKPKPITMMGMTFHPHTDRFLRPGRTWWVEVRNFDMSRYARTAADARRLTARLMRFAEWIEQESRRG